MDRAPGAATEEGGRIGALVLFAATLLAFPLPAVAQTPSTITVEAHDLASGAVLPTFQYLVNVDNTRLPNDPNPLLRTGVGPTESNSPVIALGDQDRPTVSLPDGRYLISIRSADHKMWGKHITLPQDAGTVRIDLSEASAAHPLPLGKKHGVGSMVRMWFPERTGGPTTDSAGAAAAPAAV